MSCHSEKVSGVPSNISVFSRVFRAPVNQLEHAKSLAREAGGEGGKNSCIKRPFFEPFSCRLLGGKRGKKVACERDAEMARENVVNFAEFSESIQRRDTAAL